MKRLMRLSVVLMLAALFSLVSFSSRAQEQPGVRPVADTGIVTLGPQQKLRLTVLDGTSNTILVGFRQMGYVEEDNVYRVESQVRSGPIKLAPGEGTSIDILPSYTGGVFVGVRGVVLSNSKNVRVNAQLIDAETGKTSVLVALLIP